MNIYKQFLASNQLLQRELAEYLQVTESAISNLVKGKANLSEANLIKLLKNEKGWDVSMLQMGGRAGEMGGVFVNGDNVKSPIDNRRFYPDNIEALQAQIATLKGWIKDKDVQLREKDAQIRQLLKTIADLTSKLS